MARELDALAPYYGCKRQLAARVIALLGEHHSYWEPFCGSCAVALAKPPCRAEVVNDLHGPVVNLARTVADDNLGPRLFDWLYRTSFCETLYLESAAWLASVSLSTPEECTRASACGHESASLPWAYHYFVACWMGRNGLAGTAGELDTGFCKRFTSSGGDPAVRFRNVVERVPSWWKRMRNWTILSEDGIRLCERIEDRAGCVVYVDPPYLQKQAAYAVDFGPGDHGRLAAALRRFEKTRVVVSYYRHERLGELYLDHGWQLVDAAVQKNLAVAAGKSPKADEVLLVNRAA